MYTHTASNQALAVRPDVQLRLTLLGSPQITRAGVPLGFAYDKVQALLIYLLVESRRAHRRGALAELLWPEQDEQSARHNLSQALFNLRRTVKDDPTRPLLLSSRDSLRLNPERTVWVDVVAFRELLADAEAGALEQAVMLYKGDFLEGFSIGDSAVFEEWAVLAREQLRVQAGELLRRLTDSHKGILDIARRCDYARRWVALDPLNEQAQRRLMRALAALGQRSAALAQFEQCRRLIKSELGIAPEPATIALFEELKQTSVPSHPFVPPQLPDLRGFAHERASRSPFVGRTQELADLSARLAQPECRLLTVTGIGGSGKTRLALAVADRAAAHFPQGAVFVALQPLSHSDMLVPAIVQALGLTGCREGELLRQLLDYLRDKTLLLILDNFEHILDGAPLISTLLVAAPGVTVLVTAREALRLEEEWLYPLKGLSVPSSDESAALNASEAVQLLRYHARRVQPSFDLLHEREAVRQICQITAGLPLALELVAAWLKGSSIAQLAAELKHNLDVLATTARNAEQRHRSMRAVFDQSWNVLGNQQRRIFARLCVFPSSFTGEAARHVAEASLADMATLVETSFLQVEPTHRFSIHELLRQYGLEQLAALGETAASYARHSHYFVQQMLRDEAALKQAQHAAAMQRIERDFDNIRLAWQWSLQHQQTAQLNALLNGVYLFGFLHGRHLETIALFQEALDQPLADASLRGCILARRWGYVQWGYQDDHGEALVQIELALELACAAQNRFERAFCHLMAAYAKLGLQHYCEAIQDLELSKTLFEELEEPYYQCWVLHRLGYAHANLNHVGIGNAYTEQSLTLARLAHNWSAQMICLYNLGSNFILNGNYIRGRHYCEEALQVATSIEYQGHVAHALNLVALCAFLQGDYLLCEKYTSQALSEKLSQPLLKAYGLSLRILLACLREDYAEGVRLSELAQRHRSNTMGSQLLFWARAALSCGLGRYAEAHAAIQNALALAVPEVNPGPTIWIVPCVIVMIAEIDPAKAVELLAWVEAYPDPALRWAQRWPVFERITAQLQTALCRDQYDRQWERGTALSFSSIISHLQQLFHCNPV